MSAESYNEKQLADGNLTWAMITELGRLWQEVKGLTVDGYIGPQTQASILAVITPPTQSPGASWSPWDGPLAAQPKNRTEVYQIFGDPGAGTPNPTWERRNIIELHESTALPGVPGKWYFKIHRLVEPYAREGLRRAEISSTYTIERAGCYVFRHQRMDPRRPLSYHSWGIAIDFDAAKNAAAYFPQGKVPTPWDAQWLSIWPKGIDRDFVLAMASCGWSWGGFWNRPDTDGQVFVDPMHFEWVGSAPV